MAEHHLPAPGPVDEGAQAYIDVLAPDARALFDRVHGLVLDAVPDTRVTMA